MNEWMEVYYSIEHVLDIFEETVQECNFAVCTSFYLISLFNLDISDLIFVRLASTFSILKSTFAIQWLPLRSW